MKGFAVFGVCKHEGHKLSRRDDGKGKGGYTFMIPPLPRPLQQCTPLHVHSPLPF
jgi:hypothetical protein